MASSTVRFDDALPALLRLAARSGETARFADGSLTVLRDATGALTLIARAAISADEHERLAQMMGELGSYVDPAGAVATPSEVYDERLLDLEQYVRTEVITDNGTIGYLFVADRRVIGADWLVKPKANISKSAPPIVVFASIKGGVGRSTALSITAASLADRGLRVLAVDLDLEAPGIGSILLEPEGRPEYGALDYYVEHGNSGFSGEDFQSFMEASNISHNAVPIYVVPAFGSKTIKRPENVLGKISRAYLDDFKDDRTLSFLDRTRNLVDGLTAARDFDVVLIDSRAGLHETLAAPILGLGADVLFFGVNTSQTFEGYRALFAHLRQLSRGDTSFLLRLRMVQGKVDVADQADVVSFRDRCHSLFVDTLYGKPPTTEFDLEKSDTTWFGVEDSDGPHYPWLVGENETFRRFDPRSSERQLDPDVYKQSFGGLLQNIKHLVEPEDQSDG